MNLHDEGLDQWTDRRLFGHSPAGIVKLLDLYGSIPRSLLRGCLFDFWSVATSLGRRPANKEIGNALRDALISKLVELEAGSLGFQIHLFPRCNR